MKRECGRLRGSRRTEVGHFLGAEEPVDQSDPESCEHPRLCHGRVTALEHACQSSPRADSSPGQRERVMEVLYPRCAGLDVHKDSVVACARLAEGPRVAQEVDSFGTTTGELERGLTRIQRAYLPVRA